MQATLIYNENARGIDVVTPDELQEALRHVGYHPVYKATSCEADLDAILRDVEGLIVTAGGDGTLRAVATRVIGKDVALSLLPLGTANNMAKTLGIRGTPLEIIAALNNPDKSNLDIGHVRGPWGEDYFLEGLGWGFFADTLAEYDPDQGKSVLRSIGATIKTLTTYDAYPCRMTLDGDDISGDYVLVEILNTIAVGPHLRFAPDANPRDGLLDIVCIENDSKDTFFTYLANLVTEELDTLPSVMAQRGRKLELEWPGFTIHVDAEIRPNHNLDPSDRNPAKGARPNLAGAGNSTLSVEIMPQALEFWLPKL